MTDARASRVVAETLAEQEPSARLSRTVVEVLDEYRANTVRLSRGVVEVLWSSEVFQPTVRWWDGDSMETATVQGWWDGATVRPLVIEGWWNGAALQPLS